MLKSLNAKGVVLLVFALVCFASFAGAATVFSNSKLSYDKNVGALLIYINGREERISVGFSPVAAVVDPSGKSLYVLAPLGTLHVFDLGTMQEVRQARIGTRPVGLAVSPTTRKIYVLDRATSTLSVLDPDSLQVVYNRKVDPLPSSLALDPVTHRVFVGSNGTGMVQMYDEFSLSKLASVKTDFTPRKLVVSDVNSRLYVLQDPVVSIFDSRLLTEIGTLRLDGVPGDVFLNSAQSLLYVPLKEEHHIAVFDVRNHSVNRWFTMQNVEVHGKQIDPYHWTFDGARLQFYTADRMPASEEELSRAVLASAAPVVAVPSGYSLGPEVLLNSDAKGGSQDNPYLDFDDQARVVGAWEDLDGRDGDKNGCMAREYDSALNPTLPSFVENVLNLDGQANCVVAARSDGDYVITDRDTHGYDGDQNGVFFRRFNRGGTAKDTPEKVATTKTATNQYEGVVDSAANGDFIVGYTQKKQDDTRDIFIHRFNADGTQKASEQQVNTTTPGHQYAMGVAMAPDGRSVVSWRHTTSTSYIVRVRLYDANGNSVGNDFEVQSGGTRQLSPWPAMDVNGNFVIAWQENNKGGCQYRRFNSSGVAQGATQTCDQTSNDIFSPAVRIAPAGDFVIVWRTSNQMYARHFLANGTADGGEFRVVDTSGENYSAGVFVDSVGNFAFGWKHPSYPADGSGSAVVARKMDLTNPGLGGTCSVNPTSGTTNVTSFDLTSSGSGGTGGPYNFEWDYEGDGTYDTSSASGNTSHTYPVGGNYNPKVRITDSVNPAFICSTAAVTVTDPPMSLTVNSGNRGDSALATTINGSGFQSGATVSFGDAGILVTSTTWQNASQIDITIKICPVVADPACTGLTAFQGLHDVTVTNPDLSQLVGNDLFKVYNSGGAYVAAGSVTLINPPDGVQGTSALVIITGTDFANDPSLGVSFGSGITVNSVTWDNASQLTANISISGTAPLGAHDVSVTNPGTSATTCSGCFTVTAPACSGLTITNVNPPSASKNAGQVTLTFTGCGYIATTKASVPGGGFTKVSQTVNGPTSITLVIKIDAAVVTTGFKKVKVKNSKTEIFTTTSLFQITN